MVNGSSCRNVEGLSAFGHARDGSYMGIVITFPVSNFGVGSKAKGLSEYRGVLKLDMTSFDDAGLVKNSLECIKI